MPFIGMDVNTKQLAVATLSDDGVFLSGKMMPVKVVRGAESRERLYVIDDELHEFLRDLGAPHTIFVESVPFVKNARGMMELSYVVAAVLLAAHHTGHLAIPINVSTWKAFLGNGQMEKPEIKAWVLANVPGAPTDLVQDIYDATGLAYFAWRTSRDGGLRDKDRTPLPGTGAEGIS